MFSFKNNYTINFENDIAPIAAAIEIVLRLHINPELSTLKNKYKQNFFKVEGSKVEYKNLIQKYSKLIYDNMLSEKYKSKIIDDYFTEEGIISFIFYELLHKTDTIRDENY